MPPKVAAVTMVFDEPDYLPVWARHYAKQVGADYCFVVDHGSTLPLNLPRGMNTLRLPRSHHDEERRADFVSDLVASLLRYYDWVLFTDVDELVVPDPLQHGSIRDFCGAAGAGCCATIGLDVQQVPGIEAALDAGRPIGEQRQWVRHNHFLSKPLLVREPVRWRPGFHAVSSPVQQAELYLFHLHWADEAIGLRRLQQSRSIDWSDRRYGAHQRVGDTEWERLFLGMASQQRADPAEFSIGVEPVRTWLDAGGKAEHGLWMIPDRFRQVLR